MNRVEIIVGSILLAVSFSFGTAKAIHDLDWRLAQHRRRRRRARIRKLDLRLPLRARRERV